MSETPAAIIDLRDEGAYRRARPAGAVRLSRADVRERAYLLPPRHQPLVLVGGTTAETDPTLASLRAAGRVVEHHPGESWRDRLPVETGPPTRDHVWQPATVVTRAVQYRSTLAGRRAVDLACGSGRNAVYLAGCGFDVIAIDARADALERAGDLAARHGVTIRTVQRDLEDPRSLDALSADLVVVVRYLERGLFPALPGILTPGGILAYETFSIDQAGHGHPRQERFLLQRQELRDAFPMLERLAYEEGDFAGAYLARLLARKPRQAR